MSASRRSSGTPARVSITPCVERAQPRAVGARPRRSPCSRCRDRCRGRSSPRDSARQARTPPAPRPARALSSRRSGSRWPVGPHPVDAATRRPGRSAAGDRGAAAPAPDRRRSSRGDRRTARPGGASTVPTRPRVTWSFQASAVCTPWLTAAKLERHGNTPRWPPTARDRRGELIQAGDGLAGAAAAGRGRRSIRLGRHEPAPTRRTREHRCRRRSPAGPPPASDAPAQRGQPDDPDPAEHAGRRPRRAGRSARARDSRRASSRRRAPTSRARRAPAPPVSRSRSRHQAYPGHRHRQHQQRHELEIGPAAQHLEERVRAEVAVVGLGVRGGEERLPGADPRRHEPQHRDRQPARAERRSPRRCGRRSSRQSQIAYRPMNGHASGRISEAATPSTNASIRRPARWRSIAHSDAPRSIGSEVPRNM